MILFKRDIANDELSLYFCGIKFYSFSLHAYKKNVLHDSVPTYATPFFSWEKIWCEYINKYDTLKMALDLKDGMDHISCEYIDNFLFNISLLPYKEHLLVHKNFGITKKDSELMQSAENYTTSFPISLSEKFMFTSQYGLTDLPENVLSKANGTAVIDGGAYNGNTAVLFSSMFPNSKIYSFEPLAETYKLFNKTIKQHHLENKVFCCQKGLGHKECIMPISSNSEHDIGATLSPVTSDKIMTTDVEVTTVDTVAKELGLRIGILKLDIEGFEKKALEGSIETIKKNKPIIIAAIYHNPVDFFEIKSFLLKLNPMYRFMVRRSEMVIPMADIVLIAY